MLLVKLIKDGLPLCETGYPAQLAGTCDFCPQDRRQKKEGGKNYLSSKEGHTDHDAEDEHGRKVALRILRKRSRALTRWTTSGRRQI